MAKRSSTWGGPRAGAGRYKQNLHISRDAAQSLRVLMLNAQGVRNRPDLTEDAIVEELIEAAWRELDQQYQAEAEDAD